MDGHAINKFTFPLVDSPAAIKEVAEKIKSSENKSEPARATEWCVVFMHVIKTENDNIDYRLKLARLDLTPICDALFEMHYIGAGEISDRPTRIIRTFPSESEEQSTTIYIMTGAQLKAVQMEEFKENDSERRTNHTKSKKKAETVGDYNSNAESTESVEALAEQDKIDRIISEIL